MEAQEHRFSNHERTSHPLRVARQEAGLSQTRLAAISHVCRGSINRIEQEAVEPSWPTARKLAIALGLNPLLLFPDSGAEEPADGD